MGFMKQMIQILLSRSKASNLANRYTPRRFGRFQVTLRKINTQHRVVGARACLFANSIKFFESDIEIKCDDLFAYISVKIKIRRATASDKHTR